MAPLIDEFALFLLIGLIVLVFEAHRQFNHPAYLSSIEEGSEDAEGDYIFSRSPSEIRNWSAFFSAECVYILAIVAVYLSLLFSEAVNNVLTYIIQFVRDQPPAISDPATGASVGTRVVANDGAKSAIDEAAEPFVVSVMMVTALRFPFVRRLEVILRSCTQRIFGIPWIPHRLRQKIEDTPISLQEIEEEVGPIDGVDYAAQIREFEPSALASGMPRESFRDFRDNLAKLSAYQIWVNNLRIWPSAEFRSDFRFFRDLNDPLAKQISALFKDCDLLASSGHDLAADSVRSSRRRELWDVRASQAKRLARKMAAMMALYDQNSRWPDPDRRGAVSLRGFLENVRAKDEARVLQINVVILLFLISALVSFVAGYVHATQLASIARELELYGTAIPADDPQFDRFLTAKNFMLTSLIVYGLSMWVALDVRRRLAKRGNWKSVFEPRRRIPPMGQLALFFTAIAGTVFLVYWAYLLLYSPGWSPLPDRTQPDWRGPWLENVVRQRNSSIPFAIIGGFHGTSVALMMDLGAKKAEARSWFVVSGCYIGAMMVLGYMLGQYISFVTGSSPPVQQMRELLYAVDLGLIALFTSIAMLLLLRPLDLRTGPRVAVASTVDGVVR